MCVCGRSLSPLLFIFVFSVIRMFFGVGADPVRVCPAIVGGFIDLIFFCIHLSFTSPLFSFQPFRAEAKITGGKVNKDLG